MSIKEYSEKLSPPVFTFTLDIYGIKLFILFVDTYLLFRLKHNVQQIQAHISGPGNALNRKHYFLSVGGSVRWVFPCRNISGTPKCLSREIVRGYRSSDVSYTDFCYPFRSDKMHYCVFNTRIPERWLICQFFVGIWALFMEVGSRKHEKSNLGTDPGKQTVTTTRERRRSKWPPDDERILRRS